MMIITSNAYIGFLESDWVIKVYRNDGVFESYKGWFIEGNRRIQQLSSVHIPTIKEICPYYIVMSYMGELLSKENCPTDWEKQANEILDFLAKNNLCHRDIHLSNLCVKDGVLGIVDFDNCQFFENKENYHVPGIGLWNSPSGEFDDRYSMFSVFKKLGII